MKSRPKTAKKAAKPLVVLAVDPGNVQTGWVLARRDRSVTGGLTLLDSGITENAELRKLFRESLHPKALDTVLLVETPKPRGQPTAAEEMDTLLCVGRFIQEWSRLGGRWSLVFRHDVKMAICGSASVKDKNISQALRDRFGGDAVAVGGKKCDRCKGKGWFGPGRPPCDACNSSGWETPPGPLHGITSHKYAALAVACAWTDTMQVFSTILSGMKKNRT